MGDTQNEVSRLSETTFRLNFLKMSYITHTLCDNGPVISSFDHTNTISCIKLGYTKRLHPLSCTHTVQ